MRFFAIFLDQTPLLTNPKGNVDEELEKRWTSKLIGVLFSLFSALALLSINTIVQKMNLHFDDVLFVRAVLQTSVGLILIKMKGEPVWVTEVDQGKDINKIRITLIAMALSGAIFNSTDMIAIYIMPLGDAMTIIMSSSLPTMVLAAIFQKERLRLYKLICAILVITGIVLVIRPILKYIVSLFWILWYDERAANTLIYRATKISKINTVTKTYKESVLK